jgi:catechol 2,3-dioxygenase-like lactoylglutathione lyase family enzyme
MGLELYMLGLIPQDMDKSLEFYRRLGVDFPERSEGRPHIGVKMGSDLTFFLNTTELVNVADRPRTVLEFYLKEPAAVDAKYKELIDFGYQSYRAPFEVPQLKIYFAMIYDPDRNIILLSGDLEKSEAAKKD